MPPVFTLLQQVLVPPVVWMLMEDPGAFLDVSRVNVTVAPAVQQVGQVVTELHHLAAEVWTFVDAEPVSAGRLECWTTKMLIGNQELQRRWQLSPPPQSPVFMLS